MKKWLMVAMLACFLSGFSYFQSSQSSNVDAMAPAHYFMMGDEIIGN